MNPVLLASHLVGLGPWGWALRGSFVATTEQKINGVHVVFVTSFIKRSSYYIKAAGAKAIEPFSENSADIY